MKETIGSAVVGSFAFVVSRAIALLFATSAFGLVLSFDLSLFLWLVCPFARSLTLSFTLITHSLSVSLSVCMRFASTTYRGVLSINVYYRIIAIQFSVCGCNRNTTKFEILYVFSPRSRRLTVALSFTFSQTFVCMASMVERKKALSSKSARVLRLVYQVALKCSPDKPKKRGALI